MDNDGTALHVRKLKPGSGDRLTDAFVRAFEERQVTLVARSMRSFVGFLAIGIEMRTAASPAVIFPSFIAGPQSPFSCTWNPRWPLGSPLTETLKVAPPLASDITTVPIFSPTPASEIREISTVSCWAGSAGCEQGDQGRNAKDAQGQVHGVSPQKNSSGTREPPESDGRLAADTISTVYSAYLSAERKGAEVPVRAY